VLTYTSSIYPQGRICIWVAISAAISFIANVNVSGGCYYVKVNNLFPKFDGVYIGYGGVEHLPPTSGYSYCEFWSQSQRDLIWDAPWKTGLAFSILATIFSGGPLVVSFFFSCFSFDVMWIKICAYMMILSSLFTWLSYIGFAAGMCQGGNCTFSIGAGLALIAGLNSFWTALIFFRIQPYQAPEFSPDGIVLPGAEPAPGTVQLTE
jgi:hypothetical protein